MEKLKEQIASRRSGRAREEGLPVAAAQHVENHDFKVKSAPEFRGKITFPDGTPAGNAKVMVELRWTDTPYSAWEAPAFKRTMTDEKGWFSVYVRHPYLEWGWRIRATVFARLPEYSMAAVGERDMDIRHPKREPFTIVLARTGAAAIRILDPDGKGVSDAAVAASRYQLSRFDPKSHFAGPVENLGDGRYRITGLIPGVRYYCGAESPTCTMSSTATKELIVTPGEELDGGILTLEWKGPPPGPSP